MSGPHLEIEGYNRFRRTLRRAGHDMTELRDVHSEVAQVVVGATRAPRRTGRLASTVRPGATQRAAIVRAGRASVPYAPVIHWGWPRRGIRPNPYLSTAAQRSEPTWLAVFTAAVQRIVDRVKGI